MGRKPKEYKYVKANDGRKNNGRKKGIKNKEVLKANSPLAINKAKLNRVSIYSLNAISKVFGSEQAFWESLAEFAKKGSFPHTKLLAEYKYGKPGEDPNDNAKNVNINIKNLFTGSQEEENKTIDVESDD